MIHLIINPKAGGKRTQKQMDEIKEIFASHGKECTVHETQYAGAAKDIAAKLTEENAEATIVVLGGDGTLHEVLNGVADPTRCTLGLIPSGTGNDFAAAAGIPEKWKAAAELIATGTPKLTDWIDIGNKRCMNVGGLGMDVDVLIRCAKGKTKGKIKYLKSLVASFIKFKGYEVSFECEGEQVDMNGLIVVACNGRQIGGGIKICPVADLGDGMMDVMAVQCFKSKWQTIKAFMLLMSGKIMGYPHKKYYRCKSVKVRPKEANTVQLDGELYDGLTFDAVVRSGLKFYRA
ncbi:MAG: diacylglycerol kinase family lipid kinase [Clostridia bacterium]|nr:diacylglycerol kinase family lipid kinase [Clostridia bacterium]